MLMIYGSNLLESAGGPLSTTIRLSRPILRNFRAEDQVHLTSEEYRRLVLEHQCSASTDADATRVPDPDIILRSRREIVQHAHALSYCLNEIVCSKKPLTEEIVIKIHSILMAGNDQEDVEPGKYRTQEVSVRYGGNRGTRVQPFIPSSAVPDYMKVLVKDINKDMRAAATRTRTRTSDVNPLGPYLMAARAHHQFVSIHPFTHGNGRVGRLLMNSILLKFAGHVIPLSGMSTEEKDEYLSIVEAGEKQFRTEDLEMTPKKQQGHIRFAELLNAKAQRHLREIEETRRYFKSGEARRAWEAKVAAEREDMRAKLRRSRERSPVGGRS